MMFRGGFDLPEFAAFVLLRQEAGRAALLDYYRKHVAIARSFRAGFILESVSWRASPDWGARIGYSFDELVEANRQAIGLLEEVRLEFPETTTVISGCIGPHDDGYSPTVNLSASEAEEYHRAQIGVLAETSADMVTALTMTNPDEAIGITRAAGAFAMPAAISFTVETDGRLPSGVPLERAIEEVDRATGDGRPAYFMVNCAHPTHFAGVLDGPWTSRIKGIRCNASRMSHSELDEAEVLDDGDPADLGEQYAALTERMAWLNVLGGCCGTDERHISEIAGACILRGAG